jgi:integration host factor subunit beta
VTKSELIDRVAQESGLTKGRAEMVVNTIFDAMTAALSNGDGIEIRGFGSFTVRQYKSYEGRNPRSGDVVHVGPKRLPFFKVGKELRERVNGKWKRVVKPAETPSVRAEPARAAATAAEPATRPTPAPAVAAKPHVPRRRDENLSEDVI